MSYYITSLLCMKQYIPHSLICDSFSTNLETNTTKLTIKYNFISCVQNLSTCSSMFICFFKQQLCFITCFISSNHNCCLQKQMNIELQVEKLYFTKHDGQMSYDDEFLPCWSHHHSATTTEISYQGGCILYRVIITPEKDMLYHSPCNHCNLTPFPIILSK